MPDYAGAEAAIRDRLIAGWTTTRIAFENEANAEPWPPRDSNNLLMPWVYLEVECEGSKIVGNGKPDNHLYHYEGMIHVHVFSPKGIGAALGKQYALTIGELFRRKEFYNSVPGYCVRTEDPFPALGNAKSDDGLWFGTTMTCPFVYWHRG